MTIQRFGLLRKPEDREIERRPYPTLEEIHRLSEHDLHAARDLMKEMDSQPEKAATTLMGMDERQLAAICAEAEFSPVRLFCESHSTLVEYWREQLHAENCPDFPIQPMDGSPSVSIFSLYLGGYYYRCYQKAEACFEGIPQSRSHAASLLAWAADLGDIDASKTRLFHQQALIDSLYRNCLEGGDWTQLTAEIRNLLSLAIQMGNRFRSVGYLTAGILLANIAQSIATHPAELIQLERLKWSGSPPALEDGPFSLEIMARALRCYFLAYREADSEESKKIIDVIRPKGLFSDGVYKDWEDLYRDVIKKLQDTFMLIFPDRFAEEQMIYVDTAPENHEQSEQPQKPGPRPRS